MRLSHIVFAILIAMPTASLAQDREQDFMPREVDSLRQNATSKTEFTLDHSMLIIASKLDQDNEDLRRVIAGVSGVSVHRYHYAEPGMYNPETFRALNDDYHAAGWKQLMNKNEKNGGPGVTDLWIRFDHNAITNVAILLARANEVDFFVVSGSISPLDLSHLGGHFGIPKIEGGVEVPNTRR